MSGFNAVDQPIKSTTQTRDESEKRFFSNPSLMIAKMFDRIIPKMALEYKHKQKEKQACRFLTRIVQ